MEVWKNFMEILIIIEMHLLLISCDILNNYFLYNIVLSNIYIFLQNFIISRNELICYT